MNRIIDAMITDPGFTQVKKSYLRGEQNLLTGISGTQKALAVAGLVSDPDHSCLIISYSNNQALRLSYDLQSFLGRDQVVFFPSNELFPHEEAFEPEVTAQRVETLGKILQQERLIVVTSWDALHRRLIPPEKFRKFSFGLKSGDQYEFNSLLHDIIRMGYERVDLVQAPGQFSRRGDIFDIFPLDQEDPIRIEFFGDEIDSLRFFKVETQL